MRVETGAADGQGFEGWVGEDVDVFGERPVGVMWGLVEEGTCEEVSGPFFFRKDIRLR